jgi:hypothetical protein
MLTQNFTIPINGDAIAQAQKDQLSVVELMQILLEDYMSGKIQIQKSKLTVNGFTPEFEEEVLQAEEDARQGKNISKTYDNIDEAIAHLNNL